MTTAALVGLPPGLIENVTDGTNAFLVAIDARRPRPRQRSGHRRRHAAERDPRHLSLIDHALGPAESGALVARLARPPRQAPRVRDPSSAGLNRAARGRHRRRGHHHLRAGHAALEPVPVVSDARAERMPSPRNLTAIKLLITNIQADAEIAGSSAVDIIGRAVYYLKDKGRLPRRRRALITHYLRERSGARRAAGRDVRAAGPPRHARGSAAGANRALRRRRNRPPRAAKMLGPFHVGRSSSASTRGAARGAAARRRLAQTRWRRR